VRAALADFDFRVATAAVWRIVEEANRYVEATEPWHLAGAERAGDLAAGARLDAVLGALVAACQTLAAEIWPFLPDLAARIATACNDSGGVLPEARPLFPRIDARQYSATATVPARSGDPVPALSSQGPAPCS
jgi:methionyl-tRNA synthetase